MFCSNCGKKIPENSQFCRFCGKKLILKDNEEVLGSNPVSNSLEGHVLDKEVSDKLQKRYKETGNSSIALSIFGLIASLVLSLMDYSLEESVWGVLIFLPFIAPFYYYGKKLKEARTEDLQYALKVSKRMLIYTIIFIVINLLMGGVGWLWILLLYYFYKSYRETKDALAKN